MNRIDSLSVKLIWRGLCARFVSLKLLKSSKTKRLRPQNGARLRALREQQNLRQSAFADQINAYMRKLIPNLSSTDMLTQSMVSDLELEYADLSVLHLLMISEFFGVTPKELLVSELQDLGKTEITIHQNTVNSMPTVHPYVSENITEGERFFVCSWFPSGLFKSAHYFDQHLRKHSPDTEHIEFYPLDAFIEFLFSPTIQEDRSTKISILERMQHYFSSSIYRRIYFITSPVQSCLKDPCMGIEPARGCVNFLFPEHSGQLTHIEVNNPDLSALLYKHYYQRADLVHDGLGFLEIAYQTLTNQTVLEPFDDMRFFYQKCKAHSLYAQWIDKCFNNDVKKFITQTTHVLN